MSAKVTKKFWIFKIIILSLQGLNIVIDVNNMKRFISIAIIIMCAMGLNAKNKVVKIHLIETTDVHGSYVPYDFINQKPKNGSLARIYSYVQKVREEVGKDHVLLFENGDLLQGQPIAYYYNYIATDKENMAATMTNFMGYDIQNFGNHDVETGHKVYDKWVRETKATTLGANIINTKTGKPYVQPYKVFVRDGVKIAVLGMLTSAIPCWLSEDLWSGLEFEDMELCARKWVKIIQENEHPDVIVGLFHSGREGGIVTDKIKENQTTEIAKNVPGFDVIFYGHDHIKYGGTVTNCEGKTVYILDPTNNALNVADAELTFTVKDHGKKGVEVLSKEITGNIVNIEDQPISQEYHKVASPLAQNVKEWVDQKVGEFTESIYTRDCFFGSCPFTDLIQNLQLELTGADISFTAPLAFNASIKAGDLHVSDMFNLYKFENKLCTMRLTGEEIRRHLEMSYDLWVNTMKSADDHIMLLNDDAKEDQQRLGFKNLTFNFDSAAGIDYEVDVTKPDGQKVNILRMSNGEPFDLQKTYLVAINSYRANGGGELLTKGAGLSKEELKNRIVSTTELDLRYYLMKEIEKHGVITPKANNNWKFVPTEWTEKAIERDKALLFGK